MCRILLPVLGRMCGSSHLVYPVHRVKNRSVYVGNPVTGEFVQTTLIWDKRVQRL